METRSATITLNVKLADPDTAGPLRDAQVARAAWAALTAQAIAAKVAATHAGPSETSGAIQDAMNQAGQAMLNLLVGYKASVPEIAGWIASLERPPVEVVESVAVRDQTGRISKTVSTKRGIR